MAENIASHSGNNSYNKKTGDYRPIANLRLMRNIFSTCVSAQFDFKPDRRIANRKTRANNMPLWMLSLDVSETFEKADWQAFGQALRAHGVSQQICLAFTMFVLRKQGEKLRPTIGVNHLTSGQESTKVVL